MRGAAFDADVAVDGREAVPFIGRLAGEELAAPAVDVAGVTAGRAGALCGVGAFPLGPTVVHVAD